MTWIKIKELRMNTDTGIYYKSSMGRDNRDGFIKYAINFNEEMILFETEEQRDNAIQKLDKKLNVDNLFKTEKELFEDNENE